jgi:hypothetical protein
MNNPRDARLHAAYCETITGLHTRGHFHRRLGQGGSPLNPSPRASAPAVRPASLQIASVAQSGWLSAAGMVVTSGMTRSCKEPHHNQRGYIRASAPPDQG